jgi:molecular chaperone GrpE
MSDERRDAAAPQGEPPVKVTDRRRFNTEGEPVDGGAEERAPAVAAEQECDRKIAEQAARIEELSRAYAALVEDNKSFRQRLEREKARVIEAERASIAQALLEAADDLERALGAVSGLLEDGAGDALKVLAEGVRLSLGALQKRISEAGAVRFSVVGEPFDPRVAEAVDTVAVASAEQDGAVLQEIRPGYRIGDRILRPARVRVGRLAQA